MIRSIGKAAILTIATLGALASVDCSSSSSKIPGGAVTSQDGTGTVGLNLDLAPGVTITTVNYHITGPNGFTQDGSMDVSNSQTVSFVVGGLPAGTGYTITLTANNGDGGVTCVGSAQFDVAAEQTTPVTVHLTCQRPRNRGAVLVNGNVNICPVIDSVSSTAPSATGLIQLSSSASDLDHAPSPLAYSWTVVSGPGTLGTPSAANTTLQCTAAGTVNLRLTVTDGDATAGCPDTFTTAVTCPNVTPPPPPDGGAAGAGAGGAGGGGQAGSAGTAGTGGNAGTAGTGGNAGTGGAGGAVVDAGPPPPSASSRTMASARRRKPSS